MKLISNANHTRVVAILRSVKEGNAPTAEMRRRATVVLKKIDGKG